MRKSEEVMKKILAIAKNEPRIRTVFQSGSRVNPKIKRDRMQDYNIIFGCSDLASFFGDKEFLDQFGPAVFTYRPESPIGQLDYYILLENGTSLDLKFYPIEKITDLTSRETLLILLIDKDNLITQLPVSSDIGYRVTRPSKNEFEEICNLFFFQTISLLPSLYRGEPVRTRNDFHKLHQTLSTMAGWHLADGEDYQIDLGKENRFILDYMDEDLKEDYLSSMPSSGFEENWQAFLVSLSLFRRFGLALSSSLGYDYPREKDVAINQRAREVFQYAQRDYKVGKGEY